MPGADREAAFTPLLVVVADRELHVVRAEGVGTLAEEDEGRLARQPELSRDREQPVVLVTDGGQPIVVRVLGPHRLRLPVGNAIFDPPFA